MFNWFRKPPAFPSTVPPPAPAADRAASDAHKAAGNAHFAQGQLAEAAADFRQALAIDAGNAAAHFNLGLVLREQGAPGEAFEAFMQAHRLQPSMGDAPLLAGHIRQEQGDVPAAVALYRQALAADPTLADAYGDLCMALFQQGEVEEAAQVIALGIAQHPQRADLHAYEGNLRVHQGRPGDAAACYRRALALDDSLAQVHGNLAIALLSLDEPVQALHSADRAFAGGDGSAQVHGTRARALLQLRRPQEALEALDRAVALDGAVASAHGNRGFVLAALRRHDEAHAAYQRSIALDAGDPDVHNNLGMLLSTQLRHAEALACFARALALNPVHANALANQATTLGHLGRRPEQIAGFERLLEVAPDHPWAIGFLIGARMHVCDWSGYEALLARAAEGISAGRRTIVPFAWLAVSDSARLQHECSRIYAADLYPPAPQALWRGERYGHERIRVAYLSADLHQHATAYLMAEFFERHDPARFETTALSFGPDTDSSMRRRLKRAFHRFEDVRDLDDLQIAQRLRDLEIDIAVDLKGFTTDARMGIFVHRAAPVQVSWVGYPGTLGAGWMDYMLVDGQTASPDLERFYSEKLAYLPDSYQPNDAQRAIAADTPTRAEQGLPEQGFVFCCFNNNYKITPPVFDVWMRLLRQVPGSVLWLLQDNEFAVHNLRAEAAKRDVDASRLVFAPRAPLDRHLARHRLADLFLDTLPCNAHTTASDALWAGLPLLTCKGEAFAARVAASLLQAAGLPELVTHSLARYEALALQLATEPARLAALRARLAAGRGSVPLFDAGRLCRHVEVAYEVMWRRAEAGLAPDSFSVTQLPAS